jgi:hypothetical protein
MSGCKEELDEMERVCHPELDGDAAADANSCAKAVAAMRKCVQAKTNAYEGYVRDTDKQS